MNETIALIIAIIFGYIPFLLIFGMKWLQERSEKNESINNLKYKL